MGKNEKTQGGKWHGFSKNPTCKYDTLSENRLIDHDSLQSVSRIFKAEYYRQSEFLTAGEGSNPNFIWRFLYASKYLLQKSSVKHIGNGLNPKIFNYP